MKRFGMALLLLVGLAVAAPGRDDNGRLIPERGVVHQTVILGQGVDVWYYIPKSDKRTLWPLVYSFHGASERGGVEIKRWTALADKHGFIVVCPTSKTSGAYVKPAESLQLTSQDYLNEVAVVEAMIKLLSGYVRLHPSLRMVTGFSGGGSPAYMLAFTRNDLFPMLAARSANFPGNALLGGSRAPSVQTTARNSRLLIYWGERDHPIILREAPQALQWVKSLNPAHLSSRIIPGMGHEPRPAIAADWFSDQMVERQRMLNTEGEGLHARAMAQGEEAFRARDYVLALRGFTVAAQLEQELPALGTNGTGRLRGLVEMAVQSQASSPVR